MQENDELDCRKRWTLKTENIKYTKLKMKEYLEDRNKRVEDALASSLHCLDHRDSISNSFAINANPSLGAGQCTVPCFYLLWLQ